MKPDYELDAVLELTTPEQFKALGDAMRQKILALLAEQAATTIQLAEALNSPTSTIAHHLHVLTEAGLTKVVRTRQVRAITERYFGRTAQTFVGVSSGDVEERTSGVELLQQVLKDIVTTSQDTKFLGTTISYARLSKENAEAFSQRIQQLAEEFDASSDSNEEMYGFVAALYRTNLPTLPTDA